jgi:acetyl-CoA C-acetyltransferase
MAEVRKVVLVGGSRIPFQRAYTGYRDKGNLDLMAAAIGGLVERFDLKGQAVGEVMGGAVLNHVRDFNLAREAALNAGLSPATPATSIQMACGTSLQAALLLAGKIATGEIDSAIAAGSDSVSDSPVVVTDRLQHRLIDLSRARTIRERFRALKGFSFAELKPVAPSTAEPRTGLSMGEHCELMAKEWAIARADQDEWALRSHRLAAEAEASGLLDDLIVPFSGVLRDNNVRAETSMAKLNDMKPVFDRRSGQGTLTAGNSTPLTDGAAAVLLASEAWARARGLPIVATLRAGQVAGNDFAHGDGLLMAPTLAVSRLLDRLGLGFADFDLFELHEAFAAQVLCTLKAFADPAYSRAHLGRAEPLGEIEETLINPMGSSLAYGHPFAATGARILALAGQQIAAGRQRALISVCTAGGMGVAAVLEAA